MELPNTITFLNLPALRDPVLFSINSKGNSIFLKRYITKIVNHNDTTQSSPLAEPSKPHGGCRGASWHLHIQQRNFLSLSFSICSPEHSVSFWVLKIEGFQDKMD